ncbi:MAG: glutathione S-transferase N-terminal domain-containing protein [Gammaproteobacteria bacterium]
MVVLYSGSYCPYSHRCRIVLKEKQMESGFDIKDVDLNNKPEELSLYNPYNQVPVLVDRDVQLYESNIINEYLDDRFPHPQLMPTDIMLRARVRILMHVVDRELFRHADVLERKTAKKHQREAARKRIAENLMMLSQNLTKGGKHLVDNEFTLLDASLAPLLWRLEHYRVPLPPKALPLRKYAERLFSREAFSESLTAIEKAMRK